MILKYQQDPKISRFGESVLKTLRISSIFIDYVALLIDNRAFWNDYRALLINYRALLVDSRALLIDSGALIIENRALLRYGVDTISRLLQI